MSERRDAGERARMALALGLLLGAALLAWLGRSPRPRAGFEGEPLPQVVGRRPPEAVPGPPIPIELRVDPVAWLGTPEGEPEGRERLVLVSRAGATGVPCELRFVAGAQAGREQRVEGQTVLEHLVPGPHELELVRGVQRTRRFVRVPRAAALEVDWNRRVDCRGLVFDETGAPVPGAVVEIAGHTGRCDESGRFEISGLIAGDDVLARVTADRFAAIAQVVALGSGRPLRFQLPRGYAVRGVVQLPPGELGEVRIASLPALRRPGDRFAYAWPGRTTAIRPDSRGRFRIDGIPRGQPIDLGLLHPRYLLAEAWRVAPPRHGATAHAFLQPRRVPLLTGVCRDRGGRPVPGVLLRTRSPMRRPWGEAYLHGRGARLLPGWVADLGVTRTRSGADGRFRIGIPVPRVRILVAARGYMTLARDFPRAPRRWDPPLLDEGPGGPSALVLRFQGVSRTLRVQLRWGGRVREAALLHDPRIPYRIELPRAALLRLRVYRPGGGERDLGLVRVAGTRSLAVELPPG